MQEKEEAVKKAKQEFADAEEKVKKSKAKSDVKSEETIKAEET